MAGGESEKTKEGLFSNLTFAWFNPTISLGNERALETADLPPLPWQHRCQNLTSTLESNWAREQAKAHLQLRNPKLWKAVFGVIPIQEYLTACILILVYTLTLTATPFFLYCVLVTLSGDVRDRNVALLYAGGLCLSAAVTAVSLCHGEYRSALLVIRVMTALTGAIYNKMTLLTSRDVSNVTSGHVMNLISTDVESMQELMRLPYLVTAPLQILASAAIMTWIAGWPALVGLAVSAAFVAFQGFAGKRCAYYRSKTVKVTDQRITLVGQVIAGIRAVKTHAWEQPYRDAMRRIRREEVNLFYKKYSILSVFAAFYDSSLPIFSVMLCYIFTKRELNQVVIFTLLAYFMSLKAPITYSTAHAIQAVLECTVSIRRIQGFLEEADNLNGTRNHMNVAPRNLRTSQRVRKKDGAVAINTSQGYFPQLKKEHDSFETTKPEEHFEVKQVKICASRNDEPDVHAFIHAESKEGKTQDTEANTLHSINLYASYNQLIAVIGPVGSGKSTLLSTISGEDSTFHGRIKSRGTMTCVPQIPWIFLGTVRENIIFNLPYDRKRYDKVVDACDLQTDFATFPNGDMSLIGERGIALSGGQRARVSLARAVYSDADIYLLDDPLSAVDFKVGKHLFDKCICGVLQDKLRVIVTHHLHCLEKADQVILMEKGTMVSRSSYQDFIKARQKYVLPNEEDNEEILEDDVSDRKNSARMEGSGLSAVREERDVGAVSWRTYLEYLRKGLSIPVIILLGLLIVLNPVLNAAPNWILANWANLTWQNPHQHNIILAYISLTLTGNISLYLVQCFVAFAILRCTTKLYNQMSYSLLRAPVLFFDSNPVGRILNRFSSDVGQLDNMLPTYLAYAVAVFDLAVYMLVPSLASYWLLIGSLVPITVYLWYGRRFLRVSREITRLQSLARAPLFSHVSNTVEGLTTIRMHDATDAFIRKLYSYQDELTKARFAFFSSIRWLAFRIDITACLFVTMVAMVTILLSSTTGLTGLAIVYSLQLLENTDFVIRHAALTENVMTSVQRLMEYCRLEPEPAYQITRMPPRDWPKQGTLRFNQVSLSYYDGGPEVLKDVAFSIAAQEKFGIAGRTGAGKSSILACLMRMPEATADITIDGVDIRGLNLQATRQAVSVIQQNPVLFCGSIRMNLDPFDSYTDDEIWSALHDAKIAVLASELNGKLEYEVQEGGSNFSVGERQLFCLARALLHRNKIIAMDEATANVDPHTDHLIQATIREKFKDCTVIIIAHRLSTIMDCDRIMVIDGGEVVELDTPQALMSNTEGFLTRLLQHSN